MASLAPRPSPSRLFFEPVRGAPLVACGAIIWLLGAAYCHGYQHFLTGTAGGWSGSLTWSAIAVVPWFALFEWSKQPEGLEAAGRPAMLIALVVGIAALSIALEYAIHFCIGAVSDRLGLLVMRRLPAIGVSILLIALTRKAALRRPPNPATIALSAIANAIDWVEAADNYVELHSAGKVSLRRMTMREAAKSLERNGFVRVHRRFLVNRSRIAAVNDRSITLTTGQELPIGTAFIANLRTLA